jgi:TonB family protein
MVSRQVVTLALAALVLAAAVSPVAAQDSLQRIKDLYTSAAYEDTLAAVKGLEVEEPRPEVEQYRVFSLMALGRLAEAEQVVHAVLSGHPRYRPADGDASPRIQELFRKVRSQIGPAAVKALYIEGKAALDRKDRETAIATFGEMLLTADDPDIKDQPAVSELRLLGSGFLDLSRALPAPAPSQPAAVSAPAGVTEAPATIVGPIAIRETLPPWSPANPSQRMEFAGALRVTISATGTVESAEITKSIHPAYDQLLLQAARTWRYQPARRNGVALPSEKTVSIRLKPPA